VRVSAGQCWPGSLVPPSAAPGASPVSPWRYPVVELLPTVVPSSSPVVDRLHWRRAQSRSQQWPRVISECQCTAPGVLLVLRTGSSPVLSLVRRRRWCAQLASPSLCERCPVQVPVLCPVLAWRIQGHPSAALVHHPVLSASPTAVSPCPTVRRLVAGSGSQRRLAPGQCRSQQCGAVSVLQSSSIHLPSCGTVHPW
jgi:hypothetical protein